MIDRRLQYVVLTARYGSFTAAADRAGVTQSAMTKSVAALEQQLGYAIFNRTARGVIMTEKGRNFVELASQLLEESDELMRSASAGSDPYAGALRIGVCPASLEWLLTEPLASLLARHPSIRLHVTGGSHDNILPQLRAGSIDVALGYEAILREQPDLEVEPMGTTNTVFFARTGHPIFERESLTKADVCDYDLILPSTPVFYGSVWQHIYEGSEFDIHDRLHVLDYFPVIARLVRSTDALSIISVEHSHTADFKRHFACVPLYDLLPASRFGCATRRRWSPRPAVRAFIKACREQLRANAPPDA